MEKMSNAITAMAASVIAFALATPLLIPLGAVALVIGCGLCCGLAGIIGSFNPPV